VQWTFNPDARGALPEMSDLHPAPRAGARTTFDWAMYADATLAGLSLLVPIPLLDNVSESFFRKRIPKSVARSRGAVLSDEVLDELGRGEGWWAGIKGLPKALTLGLLKAISRKLLYFLTIKAANEQLGYYWLSAFLIDYAIAVGHLDSIDTAKTAREAMKEVLEHTTTPMRQVSAQVVKRSTHLWKSLRGSDEGLQEAVLELAREEMAAHWEEYGQYLEDAAERYDAAYLRHAASQPA
jgi:hypothetical protein